MLNYFLYKALKHKSFYLQLIFREVKINSKGGELIFTCLVVLE